MAEKLIRGMSCPSCAGSLEITQGTRLLECKFCGTGLLAKGDRGISRFYVPLKFTKEQITSNATGWFKGIDKASGLEKEAKFTEAFPVYVPFWRVTARVVGWVLGDVRRKSGKNTTYVPVERKIAEDCEYTTPACEIGEFGVQYVNLAGDEILPFDLEKVQYHGMTFEVLSTPTEIIQQCDTQFIHDAESSAGVDRVTFSRTHMLRRACNIVYYPLWILRYEYKKRIYQMTFDGESGELLYGRAPGNNIFRVFCLLAGIFLGNLVLTSSCKSVMAGTTEGDNFLGIAAVCLIVMGIGFFKFRYGGEVKKEQSKKGFWKKANIGNAKEIMKLINSARS